MNFEDPTGMDGCNWWDVVCGWNSLSTDQKAIVVTVAVVAVVAASCLVGCEGLVAAPMMLASAGIEVGGVSGGVAIGTLALSTEVVGISAGTYGLATGAFSLLDSLGGGGSPSTIGSTSKTTVGDTGTSFGIGGKGCSVGASFLRTGTLPHSTGALEGTSGFSEGGESGLSEHLGAQGMSDSNRAPRFLRTPTIRNVVCGTVGIVALGLFLSDLTQSTAQQQPGQGSNLAVEAEAGAMGLAACAYFLSPNPT